MQLSNSQKTAIKKLYKWYRTPQKMPYITLGGYAGTGKTTLIAVFRRILHEKLNPKLKVAFCSYTGRAVQVLKSRLQESHALYWRDTVSTIHGLIYSPILNSNQEITGWAPKDEIEADLIITDEASMVDFNIWSDLKMYKIPIIAVGDHGQLPPIQGKFNLMENPEIRLEEIHRQAKDNPIITVSILARSKGQVPPKQFGANVVKYANTDMDTNSVATELLENYTKDTIILCGYNSTRTKINQFIRQSLGFDTLEPQVGDRVICLRNNHEEGIYNGMIGTLLSISETPNEHFEVEIDLDESLENYCGTIYGPQFGAQNPINFTKDRKLIGKMDLFDFGYALTVHKAQGSQAKRVVLFEERFKQMADDLWKKWLYTGITRAQKELYIIGANTEPLETVVE